MKTARAYDPESVWSDDLDLDLSLYRHYGREGYWSGIRATAGVTLSAPLEN